MDWRIAIIIEPNGAVKPCLETKEGQPTSLEGLALFTRLEPLVDRFRMDVEKVLTERRGN